MPPDDKKKPSEDKPPTGGNQNSPKPGKLDLSKYGFTKDGKRIETGKPETGKPETGKPGSSKDEDKKKDGKDKEESSGEGEGGPGKKKKLVTTEGESGTSDNNAIVTPPAEREAFSKKPEQGPLELRVKVLVPLPKNPDLVMKGDGGEDMPDDKAKFGGVRLTGKQIELDKENLAEFAKAPNESLWLGLVRIGHRVGKPHDSIKLYQLAEKGTPGKFILPRSEIRPGQSWHVVCLERMFAAKPDSSIKSWNGWPNDVIKAGKKITLVETGCFFGFFLIKSSDGGNKHYLNFGCTTLNQAANAIFSDKVPDMPENKMNATQKAMFRNLIEAERSGFKVSDEFEAAFRGVNKVRGILDDDSASKKMPLSWAKAVFDALKGD